SPRAGPTVWAPHEGRGPPTLQELHANALQSCKERLLSFVGWRGNLAVATAG
ncbi:hypothetical protein BHM03_00044372, partial [Ensete ventricosum]